MKRPYIIDLEASGFGPDSYPIEVGIAMEEGERFCCLIHPHPSWTHWCEEAARCHQIPRSNLMLHGKPLQIVAEVLNQLLEGKTVYSDAWSWDKTWLNRLFSKAGIVMEFRVSPLEMLMSEEQVDIWPQVRDQVEAEMKIPRHRASNDAVMIQETFLRSKALINARKG